MVTVFLCVLLLSWVEIQYCAAPGLHAGLPGRQLPVVVGGRKAGGEAAGAVLVLLQVQGGQAQLHQRTVRVPAVVDYHQVDAGGLQLHGGEADGGAGEDAVLLRGHGGGSPALGGGLVCKPSLTTVTITTVTIITVTIITVTITTITITPATITTVTITTIPITTITITITITWSQKLFVIKVK